MLNLSFFEIVLIFVVALVLLGPEKFPTFVKVAMRGWRDIRTYWDEAKRDIAKEINPVKTEFRQLSRYRPEEYIEKLADSIEEDLKAEEAEKKKEATPPQDAAPAEATAGTVAYKQAEASSSTQDVSASTPAPADPPPSRDPEYPQRMED